MDTKEKKRAFTLFEVMIVLFIIGIVGSVLSYNMRGSMERGKAFKTKEAIHKIYQIVSLEMSERGEPYRSDQNATEYIVALLKNSGFIRKVDDYVRDGWGENMRFSMRMVDRVWEPRIYSSHYERFCRKRGKPFDYPWEEEQEETHSP
ncbi:MAG: prepilin-type N-terminal cleavage/methylation domain-containing protein [Simkaniaceae bacterium]|nr:prepilin-type N-terminal cleavage/methylation domain-containing protein [Simkaniaceae bacterium]